MSGERTKLYEVEFVRTESAVVYVMAANEDDLRMQIADGLSDLPSADEWFDHGAGTTETFVEVYDSHGQEVWSGGGDGKWLAPVEAES